MLRRSSIWNQNDTMMSSVLKLMGSRYTFEEAIQYVEKRYEFMDKKRTSSSNVFEEK
jgi:hypothetical protein